VSANSTSGVTASGRLAHNAALIMEAVSMILPDDADAQRLLKAAKAAEDKTKALLRERAKAYAKSDAHLTHMGQIAFSKKPIVLGKEKESEFTTQFSARDKIYAMAYLSDELATMYQGEVPNRRYLKVLIDGEKVDADVYKEFNASDKKTAAFPFEVLADADTATGQTFEGFVKVFRSLSPRRHEIVVENAELGIKGSFTIDWAEVNLDQLEAVAKEATKKSQIRISAGRSLPEECKQFLKQSDPVLAMARLQSVLGGGIQGASRIMKVGVANLHNTTTEWDITKNNYGIPLYRDTRREICATYKANDGQCYYLTEIALRQTFDGRQYGDPAVRTNVYGAVPIACENIK
jgi:hypothetical protein